MKVKKKLEKIYDPVSLRVHLPFLNNVSLSFYLKMIINIFPYSYSSKDSCG